MQKPLPTTATPSTSPDTSERNQRLRQAAQWLLEGMPRRDVVTRGVEIWGVGRRMAQLYVACARKQLHSDAIQADHLFAQNLAQHERLAVLHEVRAVMHDPNTSDARCRVQINYLGKVTRLLSDYEESARQADETHRVKKYDQEQLTPEELQDEMRKLETESNVVDQWFKQIEVAAAPVTTPLVTDQAASEPTPSYVAAPHTSNGQAGAVQTASAMEEVAAQALPASEVVAEGAVQEGFATNGSVGRDCANCALPHAEEDNDDEDAELDEEDWDNVEWDEEEEHDDEDKDQEDQDEVEEDEEDPGEEDQDDGEEGRGLPAT